MLLEILLAIAIGILVGIFTGLTPGIHINLIAAITVASATSLLQIANPFSIILFIIAMSITHTFVDSIPSIYLGAPDADMVLTALPGHQMLLDGNGHIAIILTAIGGLAGLLVSIVLFPFILIAIKPLASMIDGKIGFILISLMMFLLLREKKRFLSLTIFLVSGLLGFTIFNLPLSQPLLPLLSGLFGVSLLILSLNEKASYPPQKTTTAYGLKFTELITSVSLSTIVGFFAAFLPGFGASQAAIYASIFMKKAKKELFLLLSGAINTIAMVLSLTTFIMLAKARNGSIIAASFFLKNLSTEQIIYICISMVLVGCIAFLITLRISRLFINILKKVKYAYFVYGVIVLICIMVTYFDFLLGLWVLITATFFGILVQKLEVSKHYLLGCLLLPTILYLI